MHDLYTLKDMLCKELKEYGRKGELTAGTLDIVDKLAHALKNVNKVIEKYEEEEYSGAYGSYGGSYGSYDDGMSNRGGSYGSYARGRGAGAKRDSMGRYARESGYSRSDDMMMELKNLMNSATDEHTKHLIQSLIRTMENM